MLARFHRRRVYGNRLRTALAISKNHQHPRQQSRPQHAQPELDEEEACPRRRGRSQEVERRHAVDRHTAKQRSAVSCEPEYVINARVVENVIAGQDGKTTMSSGTSVSGQMPQMPPTGGVDK